MSTEKKLNLMVDNIRLGTSCSKNERVRKAVGFWKELEKYSYAVVKSLPVDSWNGSPSKHVGPAKSVRRQMVDEFGLSHGEENEWLRTKHAHEAVYKALENFESWRSNGMPGSAPSCSDNLYMRLSSNNPPEVVDNGDAGFGVRLPLFTYQGDDNDVWFSADVGGQKAEYLQRVCDGEFSVGNAELRVCTVEDGKDELYLNLSVSKEVSVPEVDEVEYAVGVDVGYAALFSCAAVEQGDGSVAAVDIDTSGEYKHHRDRLKRKYSELQRKGDLRSLEVKREKRNYTEQIMNTASRKVIELAVEHLPCVIYMEDLTGYREGSEDAIHDWPYRSFQEKVVYKAKEEGIPVEFVDPANTSRKCNKCGFVSEDNRVSRDDFECQDCGYTNHADVNASINIARRGIGN